MTSEECKRGYSSQRDASRDFSHVTTGRYKHSQIIVLGGERNQIDIVHVVSRFNQPHSCDITEESLTKLSFINKG